MAALLSSTESDAITLSDGSVIERLTWGNVKDVISDFKADVKRDGGMPDGFSMMILYRDGHAEYYNGGDDIGKGEALLKGMVAFAYTNPETQAFWGKGVDIVNYDEIYDNWGGSDWRIEWASDADAMRQEARDRKRSKKK